jgi:N-hydroxyarylamine O-acetyltransferase
MAHIAGMSASLPNLDGYFARIGHAGPRTATLETLRAVQLRHVCAIPFENLDVVLGRTILLDLPAVERKLVQERRGGYCYEQNTLLAAVLRALGFHVTPLIARVRWQVPPETSTGRTHMVLRVELDGRPWLVDGGFGSVGPSAPLALDTDAEQATPHEPRRIVRRGDYLVHQVRLGAEWGDAYQFTRDEVPPIDYEVANWYSNKHPNSHFQHNLIATRVLPAGRVRIFNREFTQRGPDGVAHKREIANHDELLRLLAEHFDLHFPAGTRFSAPNLLWLDHQR